jgi:hypothetical protein
VITFSCIGCIYSQKSKLRQIIGSHYDWYNSYDKKANVNKEEVFKLYDSLVC